MSDITAEDLVAALEGVGEGTVALYAELAAKCGWVRYVAVKEIDRFAVLLGSRERFSLYAQGGEVSLREALRAAVKLKKAEFFDERLSVARAADRVAGFLATNGWEAVDWFEARDVLHGRVGSYLLTDGTNSDVAREATRLLQERRK